MLLALDAGNSNLTAALFDGQRLEAVWRLRADPRATADDLSVTFGALLRARGLSEANVAGVGIACVVPPLAPALAALAAQHLRAPVVVVGPESAGGLRIAVDEPAALGPDRIAGAVAAVERHGAPVIVADFGSATTLTVVSSERAIVGGAIAPGIGMAARALHERTGRLPLVEPAAPGHAVGASTQEAIRAGVVFGCVGAVRELLRRTRAELGSEAPLIATGGLCGVIAPLLPEIAAVEPLLTLEGVRLACERGRPA